MDTFDSRAEWLRHVRTKWTALSQRKMAAVFGLGHPVVSFWESGRNEVPDYVVDSIAISIPDAPPAPPAMTSNAARSGAVVIFNPGTPYGLSVLDMIEKFPGTAVPKSILREWLGGVR